jgi:hypothetical protein
MFNNILKNIWIKKNIYKLNSNINNAQNYLRYKKTDSMREFKSGSFSVIKLTTINKKKQVFVGTAESVIEDLIYFNLKELIKLSKLTKKNLLTEEQQLFYLYFLNEEINKIELSLDNDLISVVTKYKNGNMEQTLLKEVEKEINFKEYKQKYIKAQNKVNIWLKYLGNNVPKNVYNKLNLRTWEDMEKKIIINIENKNKEIIKNKTNKKQQYSSHNCKNNNTENINISKNKSYCKNDSNEDYYNQNLLNIALLSAVG